MYKKCLDVYTVTLDPVQIKLQKDFVELTNTGSS